MTRALIEPRARRDIEAIWDHIASESPAAADRVLDAIERMVQRVADMPQMGHPRETIAPLPVRFYSRKGITLIYRSDTDPVRILRIASRGRDLGDLLT